MEQLSWIIRNLKVYIFSVRRYSLLKHIIMTPEQPSNIPDIKDINESTVEMAAIPPTTYKIGKHS